MAVLVASGYVIDRYDASMSMSSFSGAVLPIFVSVASCGIMLWPTRLSLLVSHRASIHTDSDKPLSAVHKFAINDLLLLTATVAIGMMYFASPGKYMTFEFWSGSRGAELTLDSLLTATQVITGWMLVFGSKRVRICGVVLTAAIATMAFTQFGIDIGRYRPWHIELTKFAAFVVSVVVFAFFAFVLRRRYPQLA